MDKRNARNNDKKHTLESISFLKKKPFQKIHFSDPSKFNGS